MPEDRPGPPEPRSVRTQKPGDRVYRVRTRRTRLPLIERRLGALREAAGLFSDIATQTPVPWLITTLVLLFLLAPIPVWLFERGADGAEMTSYWLGLWWAAAAFTTAGHSGVDLFSTGGRIVGSLFTVVSITLFWGSVLAAFSSYFILTWRRPKRQLIDTINYYLQRIEELTVEEIEDLEDMTHGLLQTSRERAEREGRHSPDEM